MDGTFNAYDDQGWPLCDFCPNRAVEAEALLRTMGGGTGNYPPVGRCRAHRRTNIAANYVHSNITAAMRRTPASTTPAEVTKPAEVNAPSEGTASAVASSRASRAVSAQYTADCPTCGATGATLDNDPNTLVPRVGGQPCRAKSGRVTDTHRARIDAEYATIS